jgi:single-strand DNA-binding protein
MAQSLNRVVLIGRAGREPAVRYTPDGVALATFSLATDRPGKPGEQTAPDWHAVVCRARTAELAGQYLTKGRLICVVGRLSYRDYEAKDGQRRRTAEIVASELVLLDRRPDGPAAPEAGVADDPTPF